MKTLLIIVFIAFIALTGCETLHSNEEILLKRIEQLKAVADATDPATGGLGGLVTGILGTGATSIFAINRMLLARKRGKAIKEVNENPETPPVAEQVSSKGAQRVIIQIVGRKIAKAKSEPPDQ